MFTLSDEYIAVSNAVRDRIAALIPANPSILRMTDAGELHQIPGFDVRDLDPSGGQAQAALETAIRDYLAS